MDTVYALLQDKSVRDMTMEEVAQRAGVGKQTLYKWWPTKAALVMSMFSERIERYPEAVEGSRAEANLKQRQRRMITAFNGPLGKIIADLPMSLLLKHLVGFETIGADIAIAQSDSDRRTFMVQQFDAYTLRVEQDQPSDVMRRQRERVLLSTKAEDVGIKPLGYLQVGDRQTAGGSGGAQAHPGLGGRKLCRMRYRSAVG